MESTAIRLVITSLVVAACLLSGCGEPASELPLSHAKNEVAAAPVDTEPISDSDVDPGAGEKRAAGETGEELYRRLPCAGCHELAARPGQPVFPLEQLSKRYSVDALAAFLATPPPPMPSFDLDLEQRRKLASYLLAAHP